MASFIYPTSDNHYVRVYKLPVSTPKNKNDQNSSDFDYEVTLPRELDNVLGFKLVDWSFPRDMIPTFWPPTSTLTGNNRLDFRLTNASISATPGDFTITFPTRYFDYQNFVDTTRDLLDSTTTLMNAAISLNATWNGRVSVALTADSRQRSLFMVSTLDPSLPSGSNTILTLLFLSGPNAAESTWSALGFDVQSDESSTTAYYVLPPGIQSLLSPSSVRLRGSHYIDVFVDQSPQRPHQRVFFTESGYTTNGIWSDGVFRFEFNQDQPQRKLNKLNIHLRYEGGLDPGRFVNGPILAPHYLTFHFLCLYDSIAATPTYVQQNLSY